MKYIYKFFFFLLILVTISGCRKESEVSDLINPNSQRCFTYAKQFEAVWYAMDQGYVFWGRDTVDWDARYKQYKPIFEEFDKRDQISFYDYQSAYEGLFEGILDHHLMGIFYSPKLRMASYVRPGKNDYAHVTSADYELRMELDLLKSRSDLVRYVGSDRTSFNNEIIPGVYFALIKGKKAGELIAYFRFTDFFISNIVKYKDEDIFPNRVTRQEPLKAFYGPRYWEGILERASYANNDSVVGIIMDLRGNGGGVTTDLTTYIASLSQGDNLVGYTRTKDGFGRLDYSPWSPYHVYAPANHLLNAKPIVVLADVNSVSCAELATMLIKNLPNGTFIGERTYGAVGALRSRSDICHDDFYSGCVGSYDLYELGPEIYAYKNEFPYFIYTSTWHFVDANHEDIEGFGVKPDYEVPYNQEHLIQKKKDVQLENAIYFIKNGHIIGG